VGPVVPPPLPKVVQKRPGKCVDAFVTIRRYDPGWRPVGNCAVMAVPVLVRTVIGMLSIVTCGLLVPKPVPVIFIWREFRSTVVDSMTGKGSPSSSANRATPAKKTSIPAARGTHEQIDIEESPGYNKPPITRISAGLADISAG
jgi:hypothetical protein